MIIVPHQNAAGSKPVVTSTATAIFDLINTAASTNLPLAGFDSQVDSIDITPENGSVRVMYDGNTPTASNGQLLYEDVTYHFRGIDLLKLKLIRTGGSDVTCNAVLGRATAGEVSSSGGNSVAGSGGGGGGGAVSIADGDDAALGAKADAAASSDTGTFSLIALFKRGLQGITTLIAKDFATQTTLAALNTKVTAVNTGAVTVSSSALPTGAATEATLSTLNGKVTACNTGAVTVSSSALPTGAATETTLSTAATSLGLLDDVVGTTGSAVPTKAYTIGGTDGTNLRALSTTASGALIVGTMTPGTGAGNLGKAIDSAVGGTDTGVGALVKRKDSLATLTPADGDYTLPQVDSQGALWVRQSNAPSTQFSKTNITTATTTTVKSGPGTFGGIIINKAVASGVITIYDNTAASGTLIGTITFGGTLLSDPPIDAIYNASVTTGITIVTSAAFDLTVLYN